MKNFWQKPIHLIDINNYEDDELINQHIEGLMAIALKHGRDKEVSDILLRIVRALLTIDFNDDFRLQFSERIATYLLVQGEIKDKQQFKKQVAKLPNPVRGTIMTFAEEMKFEGRTEGLAEGRVEEKVEVAVNGLKQGLSPQLISTLTGLSTERIAQLKQEHDL